MGKEQDLASLGKTAAFLPAQEAAAITRIAAMAPDVAEHLHQKLLSELGSQAVAKDQPGKAAEMKGYGNNRASVGGSLAAAIKKANEGTLTADERGKLYDAVAVASGMDKTQVIAKMQGAVQNPSAAEGIYKELQEKIDAKIGASISRTAAAEKDRIHFRYEDFRKNGDSGKAYTPPALDEQLKKELAAVLDVKFMGRGLSDKHKAAVMTIAESSPENADKILKAAKAIANNPLSRDAKKAFNEAIDAAAIDYTIRSGGNNAKMLDALVEIAPLAGKADNRDNFDKWLKGAAAGKMAATRRDQEIATLEPGDPQRIELERQRDEAKKAQDKNSGSITNLLEQPGGMIMLFIGLILSAITGRDMLTPMMGGGKDEGQGQGAGQGAGAPAPAASVPAPAAAAGASPPAPAPAVAAPAAATPPAPAPEATRDDSLRTGNPGERGPAPRSMKQIAVEGGASISALELQKAIRAIDPKADLGSRDGKLDGDAGQKTVAAFYKLVRKENPPARIDDLMLTKDEVQKVQQLAAKHAAQEVGDKAAATLAASGGGWQGRSAEPGSSLPVQVSAAAPASAAGPEPVVPTSSYTKKGGLVLSEEDRKKLEAIKERRGAFDFRDPTAIVAETVGGNDSIEVKLAKLDSAGFPKGRDNTEEYQKAAERMVKDGLSRKAGEGAGMRWINNLVGDTVSSVGNVSAFQQAKGLEVTGRVDQKTIVAYAQELRAQGGMLPIELAVVSGIKPLETPRDIQVAQAKIK